ncbi:hypothetical protein LSH36_71g03036 [Paralvinella palmiformis]|uniref:Protein HIRA n=1 Tax=Paralvinella palmiformis TaxID=53620 RepID=A0AAD9NCX8_9ANNE|nr:hypothetical protein LSH36_71g03036 [Paralvinella palmiformis]
MRLLKPDWVSLDGKPIFSIDIHPDGSRFATGGQGDSSGKVVIWNMAPVRNEEDEKSDHVPKMLCQMDNHFGCVNCVRWSSNGRYLSSGGDDKLIMIWQTSRYAGSSTAFGSGGGVINVEQWRVGSTLRGHTGDVLDLAWSPNDMWLASCSVDNTVIVWNAQKFPEQVSVLRGHSGLVKGVTWDPVGKYLASQSDDKTLRVWRTLDWQQETCVKEPFRECGGTTHVLRLNWSPDGQYVVSAHAMNNSGPTAQIVERDGWQTNMDFVGHRKAITVVRFNPCILSKKLKETSLKPQNYTCCAIGSKDRSVSVWLTALKRPLVVTHDLFTSTVLDASWSQTGMELLVCSWDGTVAYLSFDKEEIGRPLLQSEKMELHKSLYGKTALSAGGVGLGTQIVESAELFDLQKTTKKESDVKSVHDHNGLTNAERKTQQTLTNGTTMNTPSKPLVVPPTNKQIETRTKDGRRRITPIFLAPQPEFGEAPLPFSSTSKEPQFSSSVEQSTIVVEKKETANSPSIPIKSTQTTSAAVTPVKQPLTSLSLSPVITENTNRIAAMPKSVTSVGAIETSPNLKAATQSEIASPQKPVDKPTTSQSASNVLSESAGDIEMSDRDRVDKAKVSIKRKAETITPSSLPLKRGPGRPRKDRTQDLYLTPSSIMPSSMPQMPVMTEQVRVVYAASGLDLPTPSIEKYLSIQIAGSVGSESSIVLEIENSMSTLGVGTLHKFRCVKLGHLSWECYSASKITACAGNSTRSGRKLWPSIALDSRLSILKCAAFYVMAITSRGNLFVWDTKQLNAVIKNESLVTVITNEEVRLDRCLLTEQGIPILILNNGKTYTYKTELGCWLIINDQNDLLTMCSGHQSSQTLHTSNSGPLALIQASSQRPGHRAHLLHVIDTSVKNTVTLTHLENQLSSALVLKSAEEYRFWMLAYVPLEDKLRDVCDDLLSPASKNSSLSKRPSMILGIKKRDLLQEILPLIASNLKLQRLYTEYQDQLESIK